MKLDDLRNRTVVSVEEAGEVLDLSRSAAYRAAHRGDIPTITIGRRIVVPVPQLRRLIGDIPEREPVDAA